MSSNTQAPHAVLKHHNGKQLSVHSIFDTIQGEGPYTGHRAIFIRLAYCNLQCPNCDTEYSGGAHTLSVDAICNTANGVRGQYNVLSRKDCLIVITGGEPFRQNITPLITTLINNGFIVQVETNGTVPPRDFETLCKHNNRKRLMIIISPKTAKVNKKIELLAHCFKYVLDFDSIDKNDGLPLKALDHKAAPRVARPTHKMLVYVSPMDSTSVGAESSQFSIMVHNEHNLRACINACKKYGYILSVQLHKIIGVK